MSRSTNKSADKPLSMWGLLLGLPAMASLAMMSTGQGSDSGDSGTGDSGATPPPPQNASTGSSTPPPSGLTQDQWNAAWARERAKEATAAEARMLKALGYESLEDAQAAAAARQAEADKNLSESQKATKAAERARLEADAEKASAAERGRRADVSIALSQAAVRHERLGAATTLLLADLPPDADDKVIAAAVKAQQAAMPEFYGSGGGGVDLGGRAPNGSRTGKDSYQAGLDAGKANRDAATGQHTQFLAGLPGWGGK